MSPSSGMDTVRAYHDATKHGFDRFARSAGYLDWATQPDPFRRFDGADVVDLVAPFLRAWGNTGALSTAWQSVGYDALFMPSTAPRVAPGLDAVAVFLRFGLGLSAWKSGGGSRWSLRVNPSSGNLHPTEAYVVLGPDIAGQKPGVFHYRPDIHAIERRCSAAGGVWEALAGELPHGSFLAALTSIHWREAWKYGERAFRYCQHDTGHAIATMRMAAAMMGWHARLVPACSAASLARLLGADRERDFEDAEPEEPECLLAISPTSGAARTAGPSAAAVERLAAGEWHGRANRLSPARTAWEAIETVARATRRASVVEPGPAVPAAQGGASSRIATRQGGLPPAASRLFLQRRSAVDMTGEGAMSLEQFTFLLRRLLPGPDPPWDVLWWEPRVHLALFVHRVTGLDPGLYVLARSVQAVETLPRAMRADFAWVRPSTIPEDLPLFLLVPIDVRRIAGQLSCGQPIAADGFFSVGMLAEFGAALVRHGPWFYRNLFWEAGVIGQMLYLEAEAAGARGTGIGCFFDDPVHDLLGIPDHRLQSLYHFTVGQPVEDRRLQTRPGYTWETPSSGS